MTPKLSLSHLSAAASLFLALGCFSPQGRAAGADLAQEYDQVRKIALRDSHVRDAFDKANERLEQKIVELDPALKSYAASHRQGAPAPAAPAEPFVAHHAATKPAAPPAPAAPAHAAAPTHTAASGSQKTHVVASGETVALIAHRYHVSAASIESANHISDPRKLQVGQTLIIPSGGSSPSAAAAPTKPSASATPSDPQSDGLWDKLKHSF